MATTKLRTLVKRRSRLRATRWLTYPVALLALLSILTCIVSMSFSVPGGILIISFVILWIAFRVDNKVEEESRELSRQIRELIYTKWVDEKVAKEDYSIGMD